MTAMWTVEQERAYQDGYSDGRNALLADNARLRAALEYAGQFVLLAAQKFESEGMPGWAGNCSQAIGKFRAALNTKDA